MTKSPEESIIAILVARLGGDVTITTREFFEADDFELTRYNVESPKLGMRITAARPPVTLEGEIVTAEPQSIEPKRPAHECEDWMIVHPVDKAPYCSGCGSYVA